MACSAFLLLIGAALETSRWRSTRWPVGFVVALVAQAAFSLNPCDEETSFSCMGNGACLYGACYCDPGWIAGLFI